MAKQIVGMSRCHPDKLYYSRGRCKECFDVLAGSSLRSNGLKSNYGISLNDYNLMLEKQAGKCAIFGCQNNDNLVVDHNHQTGKVRGLLCYRHNCAMWVIDDLEMKQRLEQYAADRN